MEQLSTFDLVVGAIIILLGLKGMIDGFVKEFFGLAGIIGGIYFGSRYAQVVGEWISQNIFEIKNEAAVSFVGFVVTMAAIWIGMVMLGSLVTKLTHASGAGTLNRMLGVLFGWAKVFLIFSVLIYAASSMELTRSVIEKYTKNSKLYPLMIKTGAYIIKLKPQDLLPQKVKKSGESVAKEVKAQVIEESVNSAVKPIKGE